MMNHNLAKRLNFLLCEPHERKYKLDNLSESNQERIQSLKNKYQGNRCFIIGSSPSLNLLDLTKLNHEYTFTVNRGYMLKEKGLLHSSFHVISDTKTFKDDGSKGELLKDFSDILFCYAGMFPPVKMNVIYFDYILSELEKNYSFQDNLEQPLIAYLSVIHFAIQIAYYLGFNEIYLLGVDLDFLNLSGHAYVETEGEKEREKSTSIINAKKMLIGLEKCTDWLKQHNVKIFNASPKGFVNCMPRVKYEELFNV